MGNLIEVNNLRKSFKLYHSNKDRLLNIIPFVNKRFDIHTSLDNISFTVKRGEFVSIIGKNGSGKSTLLKILCGVLSASSGGYKIEGAIVSLLELGTGFNPDLTGRENVINSARTMNFDLTSIRARIEEIEVFSDLGEYFDMPIKTYSSGMYVRLAMSLFLHLDPDLFIIDEALSVGDIFFQQKCFSKIEEKRKEGVTFLFVSHDMNTVLNMSDRVLLLDDGKQLYYGDKHEASKLFYKREQMTNCDNFKRDGSQKNNSKFSRGNTCYNLLAGGEQICYREGGFLDYLQVIDENNEQTMHVEMMRKLRFTIGYNVDEFVMMPAIAISFKNKKNILITTIIYDLLYGPNVIEIEIPFMLEAGEYSFDLAIAERVVNRGNTIAEYKALGPVCVNFDYSKCAPQFLGMVGLETKAVHL